MTERNSEPNPTDAPPKGEASGSAGFHRRRGADTYPGAALAPPQGHHREKRRLLIGVLGVLILAAALWFGIPWIHMTLNTVSTDDAFVKGRVTFVPARGRGQISRVLVDDNNRRASG